MTSSARLPRRTFLKSGAAAGLATGLAGCTLGRGDTSDGTVVQLAADSAANEAVDDINDALHDAGMPGDITVDVLPVSSDTAQQQYSQWLTAGLERPSLLRMDCGWTIPFILREQVANLDEELPDLASSVKENYFEASVSTATGPGGALHGVPLFSDFGLTLYRKDLVEDAGFDPSGWATGPRSWERFAEVVQEAQSGADTEYGYTFQAAVYEGLSCCTFNEWMASWGGSYFGARENLLRNVGERPVTVDAEPTVRAARMARSFLEGPDGESALDSIAGPLSPRAVLQWEEDSSLAAFTNGDAVAHRNWPYSVLEAGAEEAFGEDLGVMPMPFGVQPGEAEFDGMGGSVSALGGWHVTLNPNARHPEAAKEVLRAMSSDSFYLTLMELIGYVPPKPDLLDSREARDVDVVGRYVDTLKFAGEHALPRPSTVVWPIQSPRISQQVSSTLSGDRTPAAAMSELNGLLERIENNAVQEGS
ncbi:extracellular solute-binding protein [Halorarum salinum]|uniref:extracellular solute-binding protein n=1 Tax=Halorarum salinum TaxID=2743089 RepID=UPI001FE40308|nr:extracellular solute-binding protein [Halobaculum salinum]